MLEFSISAIVTMSLMFLLIVGLNRMGFAFGLLAFLGTALGFAVNWPLGAALLLGIAAYGLAGLFRETAAT